MVMLYRYYIVIFLNLRHKTFKGIEYDRVSGRQIYTHHQSQLFVIVVLSSKCYCCEIAGVALGVRLGKSALDSLSEGSNLGWRRLFHGGGVFFGTSFCS